MFMITIKRIFLSIDKFIEGGARIKLGLDTKNHANYWLLGV
jgi:hypothetical protein